MEDFAVSSALGRLREDLLLKKKEEENSGTCRSVR